MQNVYFDLPVIQMDYTSVFIPMPVKLHQLGFKLHPKAAPS